MKANFNRFILGVLPSMLIIILLLIFFPDTGLGRIIYLPLILFLNSIIIIVVQVSTKNLKRSTYLVVWTITIIITIILTIAYYPQDYGPHVIKRILYFYLADYYRAGVHLVITVILFSLCFFGWKISSKMLEKVDREDKIKTTVPLILFVFFTFIISISFFI